MVGETVEVVAVTKDVFKEVDTDGREWFHMGRKSESRMEATTANETATQMSVVAEVEVF